MAVLRLLSRLLLSLGLVLGVGLAFAWAWDQADSAEPPAAAADAVQHGSP